VVAPPLPLLTALLKSPTAYMPAGCWSRCCLLCSYRFVLTCPAAARSQNNTCHGTYFPPATPDTPTYAKGAVYLAHIWSSQIEMGLATVSTSAPYSLFNETGGGNASVGQIVC
jgi:hypothetical protein